MVIKIQNVITVWKFFLVSVVNLIMFSFLYSLTPLTGYNQWLNLNTIVK